MWKLVKQHFENYKDAIDFPFQPNKVYVNSSFSITLFGFALTAFCYEKISKKKSEIVYSITTYKKLGTTVSETFNEKDFFKLLKTLTKKDHYLYITSKEKLSLTEFHSHRVSDNLNKKLNYFIRLDDALKITGDKLDSSKKNMPKYLYGFTKKGKLNCLYKANKKVCKANKYWISKKGD